jgi:hypothetical protein
MVYIRIKKINTKPYAYLVESKNSRQKVKKYLGRVYELEPKVLNLENKIISDRDRTNFLLQLTLRELNNLGFNSKGAKHCCKNFMFCPKKFTLQKKTKSKTVKETVIALNDGHLSSFTLQRILNFKKSKDLRSDAEVLAKYFLEAGFAISRDNFVSYYRLL